MCESVSLTRATLDSAVRGQDVAKHADLILAASIAVLHRPHIDIMYIACIHGRAEYAGLLGRLTLEHYTCSHPAPSTTQGHLIVPDVPAI